MKTTFDLKKPEGWNELTSQEQDYVMQRAFQIAWQRMLDLSVLGEQTVMDADDFGGLPG